MKFLKVTIAVLIFIAMLGGAIIMLTDTFSGTANVLIVGLDDVRTDALALAAIDQPSKSVRVLSIPRDSRVSIPGRGLDKINHAYAYGGLDLTKKTVMELFKVDIDYSIELDLDSFPKIIDLIGGVDIYVEKRMVYRDRSQGLSINIPQGQQHMDGKTALHYVRFRHDPMGDIGRVQRQQKFMSLVMEKLKSPSIIPRIPSLVGEAISAIRTDMPPRKALGMLPFLNSLERDKIKMMTLPGKPAYIGGVSYWLVDVNAGSKFIAGEVEESASLAQ